jgi:hypothetical protein
MPGGRRRPSRGDVEQVVMLVLRIAEKVIQLIDEFRRAR